MRRVPVVTTAATAEALAAWVSIDAARKACHIDHTDDDAEIASYLRAAFDWLQPPEGWLGRSTLTQDLRLDLAGWPLTPMELPAGPVASIASIKYFDDDNAEQTLSVSHYFLDGDVLLWKASFPEPALYERPGAVRIAYSAGEAKPPETIKTALLQLTAHFYQHRGDTGQGLPDSASALLSPFRRY